MRISAPHRSFLRTYCAYARPLPVGTSMTSPNFTRLPIFPNIFNVRRKEARLLQNIVPAKVGGGAQPKVSYLRFRSYSDGSSIPIVIRPDLVVTDLLESFSHSFRVEFDGVRIVGGGSNSAADQVVLLVHAARCKADGLPIELLIYEVVNSTLPLQNTSNSDVVAPFKNQIVVAEDMLPRGI